jgi:hypothetical protein
VLKTVIATAALAGAVLASPASAYSNDALMLDLGQAGNGYGNSVTASCTGGPGVALDINSTTFVVRGTATGTSSGGATPLGTSISCWIRDTSNGWTWGPINGGVPGNTAVAVGTISARPTGWLTMCAEAYALFADNTPAVHYKTPGC